jgi:hypothetical protein
MKARPPHVALQRGNVSNDSTSAAQDLECTALGLRQAELLAGLAVWHCRAAPTVPTNPHPPIKFLKINRPGEHQKARRDEVLASLADPGEPGAGNRFLRRALYCTDPSMQRRCSPTVTAEAPEFLRTIVHARSPIVGPEAFADTSPWLPASPF